MVYVRSIVDALSRLLSVVWGIYGVKNLINLHNRISNARTPPYHDHNVSQCDVI